MMKRFPLALFFLLVVLPLVGCGYGEVSPKTYEYATALYSICNLQDEARLKKFTEMLEEAKTNGELPEKEADWLLDIVDRAQAGSWEQAAQMARRMLADQVEN